MAEKKRLILTTRELEYVVHYMAVMQNAVAATAVVYYLHPNPENYVKSSEACEWWMLCSVEAQLLKAQEGK